MNDLTKGDCIIMDGAPVRVLDVQHKKVARQSATATVTVTNLRTGTVSEKTLRAADRFDEAEIDERRMQFAYAHRGTATFIDPSDPGTRLEIDEEVIHKVHEYLSEGTTATLVFFDNELLDIELPPKVPLEVTMAPPGVKGNTAESGTKQVETETGLMVTTPLFIETGETIVVNTETGEYVERVQKRT